MNSTALVIFAFNRPYHTFKTIEALEKNSLWDQQHVVVFCDGPKRNSNEKEIQRIQQTRLIAHQIKGCASLTVHERTENKGLYENVVNGVSDTLTKYERIIVLEDDMITAPNFLEYHYLTLDRYTDEKSIWCNSAYLYPINVNGNRSFFIQGADCWGWSTWRNRWSQLERNGEILLQTIKDKKLLKKFTFNHSYPYDQMLKDRIAGKNQSWAILWYASSFIHGGLCSYPPFSLVENIGTDGSGTHSRKRSDVHGTLQSNNNIIYLEDVVEESASHRDLFEKYFNRSRPKTKWFERLIGSMVYRTRKVIRRLKSKISPTVKQYGWFGDYPNWSVAKLEASGYDLDLILDKVLDSTLKVKYGLFNFERDSFNYNEEDSCGKAIEILFDIFKNKNRTLRVMDFGGSLGSTYFRFKHYHPNVPVEWSIVEQDKFVETGNIYIKNQEINFYNTIEKAFSSSNPDVILLSSVLQYLEFPNQIIQTINDLQAEYILLDRTAIVERSTDRITLQRVPPDIYEASYPSWYFNEDHLIDKFNAYEKLFSFDSVIDPKEWIDGELTYRKGFLLKRKE